MNVEIWSDIACPWCYVGKRRFEAALAAFEHRDDVTVTWRSFELDPTAPREREVDGATHLADKYGTSRDQALAMHQRMTDVAAEVREDEATAARFGIHAVPFYVVDRALGASGAQPAEIFGELLRRGWEAQAPTIAVAADGETCGVDGC